MTTTPPAMTPEQRAALAAVYRANPFVTLVAANAAGQLEADGLALAAAHAEIARLNAKIAAAYEAAARVCDDKHKKWAKSVRRDPEKYSSALSVAAKYIRALATQPEADAFAAALATAREDGMREAAQIVDEKYAKCEMGNPGHHIFSAIAKGATT